MTQLDSRQTRRALRLSVVEAILFASMLGWGEAYFIADGVRLGATALELGLLVTLPLCLGALGPVAALGALSRWRRRRSLAVMGAAGQASTLVALTVAEAAGWMSPPLLIGLASLYQIFGQGTGVPWASWYGDVVPRGVRGRYFARRARWAHFSTFLSALLAGLLLQVLEPGGPGTVAAAAGGSGFVAIFGLAAAARLASCCFLAAAPEPDFEGLATPREAVRLVRSPEGRPIRQVLVVASLGMLFVYVASPYFGPYMLREIRFSYLEYTLASMTAVLAKWATLPAWGRAIDRAGARSAYRLAVAIIALIPLPWLFANGLGLAVVGMALSGLAWGGHEVAHFSMLLESATSRLRPAVFAVTNTVNGGAQLLGGLIGGALLGLDGVGYRSVFGVSMALRLLLALALPWLLTAEVGRRVAGAPRPLLRMMGFRPSGGVALRPLAVRAHPDEEEGAASGAGLIPPVGPDSAASKDAPGRW